jgi:hypothetical protein
MSDLHGAALISDEEGAKILLIRQADRPGDHHAGHERSQDALFRVGL